MQLERFSTVGLLLGILFYAFSLTPSLVPRNFLIQGYVSGLSLSAGYGLGVVAGWLWSYLQLPVPNGRIERIATLLGLAVCTLIAGIFLWQASEWQNSVRALMDMEPVDGAQPLFVALVALLVFGVLLTVGKLFRWTFRLLAHRLRRFIPERTSNVISVLAAAALFWAAIDGILFSFALRMADSSYQQINARIEDNLARPENPLKTGSPASLVAWQKLGRQGREFVSSGPSADDLAAFLGEEAMEPIRVYVGLNSAETPQARARLALEELQRVGAFERSVLVLVTPTGTGWVDPAALDTVEYLHRGDIASVAVQYSYLPSPLSLLIEAEYGAETARAVFSAIYGYWSSLAPEARPALYLHGLSLGALNSDLSFHIFDIIDDMPQGALWSGPPFRSELWRSATQGRDPGSPAWLPLYRGGTVVRFANQETSAADIGAPWGPFRIVYLQYASDPVTFFDALAFYREPEWMREPRGPDVSPELRWYPVVTMLQLAVDMMAGSTPPGYGHDYAAEHYIDAWLALMEPEGWTEEDIRRLKALFASARER
ncbi:alpha/beta-hydrolase family protein [Telmatospirillum sp. J64-1]|uniref:alpha/beta hydrolase n=1 Tax=Telmatospirillum sp. J64-1 TaxID=2502183 RepID=UPI00115ECB1B|nr:alpha/beta-hydrolase family protein [Telmatospirillum sp. J64-1]